MFNGAVWKKLIENCINNQSVLHFIGLLSDGNVHSHIDHLRQMISRADSENVPSIRVHVLLDGRDVGETSALNYLNPFEEFLMGFNLSGRDYRIASGGGRMGITMDRYGADWDMVKQGWETHVLGKGRQFGSALEAIETYRREHAVTDQNLPSFIIGENGRAVGEIKDCDSVILYNFRGDRAIELCNAFELDSFDKFDRKRLPNVSFAGMMQYDADEGIPENYLVSPPELDNTMGEYMVSSGIRLMAISETQKYGHVTYFFNGNRSSKFNDELEDYMEITSDNIPFEERPWMKAAEITDEVITAIESHRYGLIRLNFPNGDMVGHTGNFQAATISVEAVDLEIARLMSAIRTHGGVLILTADHGNADEMYEWDEISGEVKIENEKPKSKTRHTLNPVPCYIFDPEFDDEYKLTSRKNLGISSLAATCINLMGFQAPEEYDPSIIEFR